MQLLEFKSYKKNRKINTLKIVLISIIVIAISVILTLYITNEGFRQKFDKYILRKEIVENNATYIKIDSEGSQQIYAYDKYIAILEQNILTTYGSSGNKIHEFQISISNPIFKSNNRFLAIAEYDGQKICLISGSNIIWQGDIEGQIIDINVNKNGYISVIISSTSYKNIIILFDPSGKQLFKTYLSSTTAITTDISNDNKYLAIAEIDTSGTTIQSNIKIISISKAQSTPSDSVIKTYNIDSNKLVTNLKYQDKNKLVCMYDDSIHVLYDENNDELIKFEDNKILFSDINLKNYMMYTVERPTSLFSSSTQIILTNIHNKNETVYTVDSVVKSIKVYDERIAINLGSEVHFINQSSWLIKKYISTQEIKDIVLGESIAGIVYRDKIEIVNL